MWRKFGEKFRHIFVLQFPGEVAARNFKKNWRQIRLAVKQKSFTAKLWGAWGRILLE